jgi:8-oxo-dGTP diphosphatase
MDNFGIIIWILQLKESEKMNRRSEIELANMCLIYDNNRVLVQEKVGTNYKGGLVFPGGHIEQGESLRDSVIREMKEETGLTISNPQPCGFKDWIQEDGTRYLVLLYKTDKFEGKLKSSDEGRIFWLDRKDMADANLIWNMRELLEIFETDDYSEFFFVKKDGNSNGCLLGSDEIMRPLR